MFAIKVNIIKLIDPSFPGFLECEFTDRFGKSWRFVEKDPVVSLDSTSSIFPRPGVVACCIVDGPKDDETGRPIVEVDTDLPWGIEATDGTTRFSVFADQLVELPDR